MLIIVLTVRIAHREVHQEHDTVLNPHPSIATSFDALIGLKLLTAIVRTAVLLIP